MSTAHTQRNYGIDLLRCLSMFFVVVLHHLLHSGGLASDRSEVFTTYWIIEILAFGAVDMFAIISGYVGYRDHEKPLKISGALTLWAQAIFYNFLIIASIHIFRPDLASSADVINSLFPISSNAYWYLNAYIGLVILQPLLDLAVRHISEAKMKKVLLFTLIVFSLSVFSKTNLGLSGGYSVLWISILYVLGAAMKKFKFNEDIPSANVIGFGIIVPTLITIALALIPNLSYEFGSIFVLDRNCIVNYLSPTVVIPSASMVLLFSRIKPRGFAQKIIEFCAPNAFAVYLINTQPILFSHLLDWQVAYISSWGLGKLLLSGLLFCLVFFIGAILIDKARFLIFKLARLDKLFKSFDAKLAKYE